MRRQKYKYILNYIFNYTLLFYVVLWKMILREKNELKRENNILS